jgi:hypothetical protein
VILNVLVSILLLGQYTTFDTFSKGKIFKWLGQLIMAEYLFYFVILLHEAHGEEFPKVIQQ